jgi:hypothetical protein
LGDDVLVISKVLLGIYFCVPVGMVTLMIIELILRKKNPYSHIVDIIKFDVFLVLALLSLSVEAAKVFNIPLNIGLSDIIAGLATLVALDRVLVFAKIAFEKKSNENASINKEDE